MGGVKRIAVPLHDFVTARQKVVVGLPMYRQVSAAWLFNWWRMEKQACVGLVSVEGARLPLAMTRVVEDALRKFDGWQWLVVLEDDVVPPVDAFDRVAEYSDKYDIVTGLHFGHEPPYRVLAFEQAGGKYEYFRPEVVRGWVENPGFYEVDAVPMGFTAIGRHVLEEWDPGVLMWQPDVPGAGQDVHFCKEARKQGRRIWVDSGLRCAHLSEVPIDYSHHQAGW